MNALEIKEGRKKLGITQKELAELIGVSTQTINGYENGKEIPTTKHQILDTVLNKKTSNLFAESSTEYTKSSGFDRKISELKERINGHEEIIKLLGKDAEKIKHHKEIIKLLNTQIEIIEETQKNKDMDI